MSQTNIAQGGFRKILQSEFVERCKRNPSYSLRAFAKSLDIPASPLSAMLRGKRPITPKMELRLGRALGVQLESLRSSNRKLEDFQQMQADAFEVVSDWYHFALLELIHISGFKPDYTFVSKKLGITPTEVQIAVERLVRVGMLRVDKRGRWHDISEQATSIPLSATSPANRKNQRQILEKALRALDEVPVQFRSQTSMTMAINPSDLPMALEKIKIFRRELCALLEKNKKRTDIYNLCISLYPIHYREDE